VSPDSVSLRGMRFHASVGTLPHEREHRQPVDVDLTIWLAAPVGEGPVLDYRALYDIVAGVIGEAHIDYLEQMASRIAARVLDAHRVPRVRVVVRKPHVALPGPLAGAEVSVERTRDA
jgi:dihydroneopterin aldolase